MAAPAGEPAAPSSSLPGSSLPWSPLLALGTAVFITSLTETLPAGVLPEMAGSLDVGPAAMGQAVTIYAAGTALTAIPLARATARVRRKRLLLIAMAVFALANTLTALAPTYPVALGARFTAGVAAGLAWALLAGYASRLAPAGSEGRAIAVAMTGIPLALSLGVPVGTFVGQAIGWRAAFGAITVVTLAVLGWILAGVPDVPDNGPSTHRISTKAALAVPGVASIMVVVLLFVLGHTVVYAYVAPYLIAAGLGGVTDLVLLAFGGACLLGIWYTGRHIDGGLRRLAIGGTVLFVLANAVLAATSLPVVVWAAAIVWGLGWGGAPTWLQTAAVQAGGRHSPAAADAAQAMLVTLWNAAMALGGLLGGVLLATWGVPVVPAAAAVLGALALAVIVASRNGFPGRPARPRG